MTNAMLQIDGLHKSFLMGNDLVRVLKGVTLTVGEGEFLAVMGSSGCGKSTLLHIVGALEPPDQGLVMFGGRDLYTIPRSQRDTLRNRDVGFVFQFYHLLPELNVYENILLPRMVGTTIWGWPGGKARARREVDEMIELVGLSHRRMHRPEQLSGGERQRAAIARAIANRPRLLLADEPTGNLDAETGKRILAVLSELNARGQTIVMVTHDHQVAALAHRRVQLSDGRIAAN